MKNPVIHGEYFLFDTRSHGTQPKILVMLCNKVATIDPYGRELRSPQCRGPKVPSPKHERECFLDILYFKSTEHDARRRCCGLETGTQRVLHGIGQLVQ